MRKTILKALLAICCISQTPSYAFFDIPQWYAWKHQMEDSLDRWFAILVPDEQERNDWRTDGEPWIGDTGEGAGQTWVPYEQSHRNYKDKLLVKLWFKPHRIEKRQYKDIQEVFETFKKNYGTKDTQWKLTAFSSTDGIIEHDKGEGKKKVIGRTILSGNWSVTLEYEFKPSSEEENQEWGQKREFLLNRLKNIKIEK